jgi:C4-dicarboxylate transporter DctM subunit
MSLSDIAILGIVIFLVLMFFRMPIGLSLILTGFIGVALIRGLSAALFNIGTVVYSTATTQYLTVIPLFLLMGTLAAEGGVSKDAFDSIHKWVGHLPGGLAMACVCACAAFGAVCGSHGATAATMMKAAYPQMKRHSVDDTLSLASISSGGTLGFMIPPSGAFIIYGFVTMTPIGSLFIGGILPGLLLTVMFCIQIYIQCIMAPQLAPLAPKSSWADRIKAIPGLLPILVIFLAVMGGIYSGFVTPTEAASIGAFATFLVGLINRQLTWGGYITSFFDTVKSTAMIFLLLIGAMVFNVFLTTTEVTLSLGTVIQSWNVDRYVVMWAVLIVFLIAGCFMEGNAVVLVTVPIVWPVLQSLGFDPVHFGVLIVLTVMIGALTPPFGVVVYLIHGMAPQVPLFTLFRGCYPFVATMVVCLAILTYLPDISTVLPGMMIPYK